VLACGTKVRSSGTRESKKNGTKVEEKSREEKKTETKKWLHVIRFCLYVMLHINNSKDEAKGFQGKKIKCISHENFDGTQIKYFG
jgi:hypothetical protein